MDSERKGQACEFAEGRERERRWKTGGKPHVGTANRHDARSGRGRPPTPGNPKLCDESRNTKSGVGPNHRLVVRTRFRHILLESADRWNRLWKGRQSQKHVVWLGRAVPVETQHPVGAPPRARQSPPDRLRGEEMDLEAHGLGDLGGANVATSRRVVLALCDMLLGGCFGG